MSFYLDTSVLVPLYFPEATSAAISRWLRDADKRMIISDLAVAEFSSSLSRNVRMGRLSEAGARRLIEAFNEWRGEQCTMVEIQPVDLRDATNLVQKPQPKLLAPDAIHLAASRRLGLTLVSFDSDLVAHARDLQIPVISPS